MEEELEVSKTYEDKNITLPNPKITEKLKKLYQKEEMEEEIEEEQEEKCTKESTFPYTKVLGCSLMFVGAAILLYF